MKRKLLIVLLSITLSVSSIIPCFAEPETTEEGAVLTETEETIPEDDAADEETEEATEEGEEWVEDYIRATDKSEENNAQITFDCSMPTGFNLATELVIMNNETGNCYQILATSTNAHKKVFYVPNGSYTVVKCDVFDDGALKFPMTPVDDFSLEENGSITIASTLTNYDEIETEAHKRLNIETEEVIEEVAEEPVIEEVKPNVAAPWRVLQHEGDGNGRITMSGTSNGQYQIVIEVTTTGKVMGTESDQRAGEIRYSLDNGQTWTPNMVISNKIELVTPESFGKSYPDTTGLTLEFNTSDLYLLYDVYRFNSDYEYAYESSDAKSKAQIRFKSSEALTQDYNIVLRIAKTGKNGEATFQYDLHKKKDIPASFCEPITIPENGEYTFIIENTNEKEHITEKTLTINFWDNGIGSEFIINDEYTCVVKGTNPYIDYTPFYITLLVIIGGGLLFIFFYFYGKKEKACEYILQPYERVKVPTKRKKEKKSKKKKSEEEEE